MSRAVNRNCLSEWMWQNDISPGDIILATGASQPSVSLTIKGERNDGRVLDYLRKKGCTELLIENRTKTLIRRNAS